MNFPPQLTDYITQVQRLLHDTAARFWATTELTDYINQARNRVTLDTGCLRSNESVPFVAAQETYSYPSGVMDVININYQWSNLLYGLKYYSFSQLNSRYRLVTNLQSPPEAWGQQQQLIYIEPIPNQNYTAYFDCILFPTVMVNPTDTETIPYPFYDNVPYYAAYLAVLKQGELQKAQWFQNLYTEFQRANAASRTTKGYINNGY